MTLVSDPWCEWPDGYPYAGLGPKIGPHSSLFEVRETFADLLADELVDDEAREALRQLEFVGRRLGIDALLYDEKAVASLQELVRSIPDNIEDEPLNERIPLSWDM